MTCGQSGEHQHAAERSPTRGCCLAARSASGSLQGCSAGTPGGMLSRTRGGSGTCRRRRPEAAAPGTCGRQTVVPAGSGDCPVGPQLTSARQQQAVRVISCCTSPAHMPMAVHRHSSTPQGAAGPSLRYTHVAIGSSENSQDSCCSMTYQLLTCSSRMLCGHTCSLQSSLQRCAWLAELTRV